MGIWQSASGYAGIEASPLARIDYSPVILSRVYENDWLPRITEAELLEPVTRCGQQVQIMRAPEVGPMRSYQKNQQLVPNTVGTDAICLTICNAAYQDIKFDSWDIKSACDRWPAFEEKMLESIYQSYVDTQRRYVLGRMISNVSPATSLDKAGRMHDVDLGTPGNPLHVTPANLPVMLARLQRVLLEQKRWKDGEMFIIVPPALRQYIAMSNYSNSEWSCSCGMIVDGMWDKKLFGFTVIESIHVPAQPEGTSMGFYILAGHKSATAYASNIIEARLIDRDADYFGIRYQFLVAWGAEVIYPDALALGYWVFDPIV